MKDKRVLWITTTAVLIALLVVIQAVTAPLSQFVTGSLVNLILIVSTMTYGFASGLTVAILSPIFAKLLGIGPFWEIIPFVIVGSTVLVLIWHLIGSKRFANVHVVRVATIVMAAICKSVTLYIGIARVAVPFILDLPEKQAAAISSMFSINQLITALIGGALALGILPVLEIVKKSNKV